MLSKKLATIKVDIELNKTLEDFSVAGYDEAKLKDWCKKLDIKEESVFGKK